ncbi:MAG: cytochrome c biosis protein CcmG, thiol:disulfide interchange protein DsbE [Solirubrobacteraceae bacterium]|jgi:thiol-disulfide isomerase/thioredoxin|nr:cytochrome c biosis protein CcmG, thiol:disulfide interchange protein DsbE [Solirubrobacteraceae bacterium]
MRKLLIALGVVALVIVVIFEANKSGGRDPAAATAAPPLTRAAVSRPLAGAPAELAALHARVNELAPGGKTALDAQLRALRGHPVVVNLWASWCDPCRHELPFFQRQALKRGARVAFLGVNSNDNGPDAQKLGARYPMPYPSFVDPRLAVAGDYGARGLPATAFYDAGGTRVLVHQGGFTSETQLAAEIDRYALGHS